MGLLAFSLIAGFSSITHGSKPVVTPSTIAAIEEHVRQGMEVTGVPGLAVALIDGASVVHFGYGVRNRSGDPVTPQTTFRIASSSKPFTAFAAMQLIESNQLALDSFVIDYLPSFHTRDKELSDRITIRHLLTQTSGLSTYVGNLYQSEFNITPVALDSYVARLSDVTLTAEPGEKFQYSNANWDILGLIIERITDQSFESFLTTNILVPLSMNDSFLLDPRSTTTSVAEPFRYWLKWPRPFDKPFGRRLIAAGGIAASADDLARFIQNFMAEDPVGISAHGIEKLISLDDPEVPSGYAMGWFVEEKADTTLVYHDGMIAGYSSLIGFIPERNVGFVILANASTGFAFGNVRGLTEGVMDILSGSPVRSYHAPIAWQFLLVSLVLISLLVVLDIARTILRARTEAAGPDSEPRPQKWFSTIGLSCLLLFLTYASLVLAPGAFDSSLWSIGEFLPDVVLLLLTLGTISGVWAFVRIYLLYRLYRLHRLSQ